MSMLHSPSYLTKYIISNLSIQQSLVKRPSIVRPTTCYMPTVVLKIIQPPDVFPLTSIANKSCKIECCVKSMLPINQNMMYKL